MASPPPPRDDHGSRRSDHGIKRDSRGEDQPTDKRRAQQTSIGDQSGAGREQPPSPGEPAGGE
jgi:hypothetical protein